MTEPGAVVRSSGGEAGGLETPLERLLFALLAGGVIGSSRLGIANPLLGLALVGTLWEWRRLGEVRLRRSPIDVPLVAFVAGSLLSVAASVEPSISIPGMSSLFSFLLVPLVMARIGDRRMGEIVLDGLALVGSLLAVHGLIQFAGGMNDLHHRIRGPLSHYMTFAGVLLLYLLVCLARVGLGPGSRRQRIGCGLGIVAGAGLLSLSVSPEVGRASALGLRALAVVLAVVVVLFARMRPVLRRTLLLSVASAAMLAALALSYTRNAWIGLVVGSAVILVASVPRAVLLFVPAVVLLVVVLPRPLVKRVAGTFSIRETSNYDRLCMIEAGIAMIQDRPLTGMGLDAVKPRYPLYRRADAPRFKVPHLHNNFIQIGAERGLFTLGAYVGLLAVFFTKVGGALRRSRTREEKRALVAPLAAIAGITVAGLFEANFSDTEVLLPTLFLLTLPFADGSVAASPSRPAAPEPVPAEATA